VEAEGVSAGTSPGHHLDAQSCSLEARCSNLLAPLCCSSKCAALGTSLLGPLIASKAPSCLIAALLLAPRSSLVSRPVALRSLERVERVALERVALRSFRCLAASVVSSVGLSVVSSVVASLLVGRSSASYRSSTMTTLLPPPPLPLLRLSSLLRRILVICVSYSCAAVLLQTILHPTIQILLHPRMRGWARQLAVLPPPTALPLPLALALLRSATPIKSSNAPFVSGPQPVPPAPHAPRI
jgi:hypothetical protein